MSTPIHYIIFGTTRNILAGAGLCYAIQQEKYLEIPLTLITPSIYAGYHLFKEKERIIDLVLDSAMHVKKTSSQLS
jgi:hypothetical protein